MMAVTIGFLSSIVGYNFYCQEVWLIAHVVPNLKQPEVYCRSWYVTANCNLTVI